MLDTLNEHDVAVANQWLSEFASAAAASDEGRLAALFVSDGYWRDLVALSWNLETVCGDTDIAGALVQAGRELGVSDVVLDEMATPPSRVVRIGRDVIEAFFRFETRVGRALGVVRLLEDNSGAPKAWTLLTALDELKGHEERSGRNRPTGQANSRDFRGPNWLDKRNSAQVYDDHDPVVLVVGGGQAGLASAARLTQLGVDTLIIDKGERVGDNWRKRYHALTLHNQVQVNHLPYMPFPPTWPTYIPKDKLANWFEAYVEAMELNYWTSTELVGGTYDEAAEHWDVTLRGRDGALRDMHPRHIVMATGVSGIANIPDIATLEKFKGPVVHSSQYSDGEDWSGKRAIVIGTGNSGHDISQDLFSSGAQVTMVQRSPTLVTNIEPAAQLPYKLYSEPRTTEECDMIASATPMPLVRAAHQEYTRQSRELDKEILAKLQAIGFKLDHGEDDTGWQFKYLTRGGGYYFNVGCSDLLAEGKIDLLQFGDIETFTEGGLVLKNGEKREVDLIVLSTGYKRQEVLVERLFGREVADRVGPIWGFGEELELRNMYRRTGQPGLWFVAGSLAQCRINSKYMALQVKAIEEAMIGKARS